MKVILNGKEREVTAEITVSALLSQMDVGQSGTAVAINGEIVPRKTFGERKINAGDEIDLLRAIGGG